VQSKLSRIYLSELSEPYSLENFTTNSFSEFSTNVILQMARKREFLQNFKFRKYTYTFYKFKFDFTRQDVQL